MRETFAVVEQWMAGGASCALATLVESIGAAPAPLGATLAVDACGRIAGNIGAGCYESDIVESCLQTLADGQFRLLNIDLAVADEVTGSPGCGGNLKIAVWKPLPTFHEKTAGIISGERDVIVELQDGYHFTIPGKRRLTVIGATMLAEQIAYFARPLDFRVAVIDPRPPFATNERIPSASEVVTEWPDDYLPAVLEDAAAVVVVSHDPKLDVPALAAALRSAVPYIGLLGSRRTQTARRDALRELGFDESALKRIHGPVGLDLGGSGNGEAAISILAQIVADANGRSGAPLDQTEGPIRARC